jgi:hypothetical protein
MSETTETVDTATTETVGSTPAADAGKTPEQLAADLESAQRRIHELNKENEKRRKQAEEQERQQRTAEEKRLAEQGEFKSLAATREAERDAAQAELQSAAAKLARLNEILSADIAKRIEAWPLEVRGLVPDGEGVDALQRLERITELEPLAQRLMKAAAPGGNSAGPVPSAAPALTIEQIKQKKRESSEYLTF